jgi:hypothetical protein
LPSAKSDQNLTLLSTSTQDLLVGEVESDDNDQWGSLQQETFPGPTDPSITKAMRIRRDTSNASNIAIAKTAYTTLFIDPIGPCMGRTRLISPYHVTKTGYACVDSGATHHMLNGVADDFSNYKLLPKGSHVLVADNNPIECLGIGIQFLRIDGCTIGRRQVLHVPALMAPLISVRQHRRNQGCSFIANNAGCYLTFPNFSITVDDSTDCLLAYEIINPKEIDFSKCDYMQDEPDRIDILASTETRRLDNKRKSRTSPQQPHIRTENKQGFAWKVETRASLRRQKEQTALKVASDEQINKTRLKVSRLEQEAQLPQQQLHSARPEAPTTDEEKQEIIKSLKSIPSRTRIQIQLITN